MIPPEPEVPDERRARGTMTLRYEDVTQDGRVALTALPGSLGVVWRELGQGPVARALRDAGVVPVLTRIVLAGASGTVSVMDPLEARGCYEMAHTQGPDGEIDRIVLLMWTTITGRRGRTHGPPPPGAGEPVPVGRVFAEHVFTRLFAPPDQRKVLSLGDVPPARYDWKAPAVLQEIPPDATALDETPVADDASTVFGLDHTDSNQHVNSLVYPQLFADAALRRFAVHGHRGALLSREVELAFRKPSFAGDAARVHVRAFAYPDGRLGAAGSLQPEAAPGARPLVTARIRFER